MTTTTVAVPLVLLSGMNCTADLWSGVDFGSSPEVFTPVLDQPAMAAQVAKLLAELPERFVLVGLSLGGIVAMAMAIAAPERVAGLCVLDTNAKAPTQAQQAGWQEWIAKLDGGVTPRDMQQAIMSVLFSADGLGRTELVERALAQADETGVATLRAQLQMQGTRTNLLPGLAGVNAPALVVSGLEDALCPLAFHEEIAQALPRAQLVSIPGGHLLPMEAPELFGAAVRSWRKTLPAG